MCLGYLIQSLRLISDQRSAISDQRTSSSGCSCECPFMNIRASVGWGNCDGQTLEYSAHWCAPGKSLLQVNKVCVYVRTLDGIGSWNCPRLSGIHWWSDDLIFLAVVLAWSVIKQHYVKSTIYGVAVTSDLPRDCYAWQKRVLMLMKFANFRIS